MQTLYKKNNNLLCLHAIEKTFQQVITSLISTSQSDGYILLLVPIAKRDCLCQFSQNISVFLSVGGLNVQVQE